MYVNALLLAPPADTFGYFGPQLETNRQMVFTWDWENSCVIYEWWHIKTLNQFLLTLVAIVALGLFYEFSRAWISTWRSKNAPVAGVSARSKELRIKLSLLYAFQVGYSFMLMLVFMTYNGWYMLAVTIGAGLGHYFWGSESESRAMSCH